MLASKTVIIQDLLLSFHVAALENKPEAMENFWPEDRCTRNANKKIRRRQPSAEAAAPQHKNSEQPAFIDKESKKLLEDNRSRITIAPRKVCKACEECMRGAIAATLITTYNAEVTVTPEAMLKAMT
ncbi:hypothetical protein BTVI_69516 [Pitangus sulphuratus]|nr:hypothetical protein BTVI_69516 [Pitangus sulphuratus]